MRTVRNLTLGISEDTYQRARVWAAQHDTSISAIVEYLLVCLPTMTRLAGVFPSVEPVSSATGKPHAPPAPPAG